MSKKPTFTTAIEWHDAKTDPPKKSGNYICCTGWEYIQKVPYSARHKIFNAHDEDERPEHGFQVALWAHIPKKLRYESMAPYREGDGA